MFRFYHTRESVAFELTEGLRDGSILLDRGSPSSREFKSLSASMQEFPALLSRHQMPMYGYLVLICSIYFIMISHLILIGTEAYLFTILIVSGAALGVGIYLYALRLNREYHLLLRRYNELIRKFAEKGVLVFLESEMTIGLSKHRVERDGVGVYEPFLHFGLQPSESDRCAATVWSTEGDEREFDDLDEAFDYSIEQLEHT